MPMICGVEAIPDADIIKNTDIEGDSAAIGEGDDVSGQQATPWLNPTQVRRRGRKAFERIWFSLLLTSVMEVLLHHVLNHINNLLILCDYSRTDPRLLG